ncbi:MAG: PaaI family thioesterase [Dehalococcoidia bacterium]
MTQLTAEPTRRSLQFNWSDPLPTREFLQSLPGLESIRAIQSGQVPPMPFAQVMGLSIPYAERGRVTFAFTPTELWQNPMGTLHGGAIGTLLDSAMGMAVLSTLDQGVSFTTLEYKVNFLRPVFPSTGEVYAEGTIAHEGKTQAVVEARLTDANGKVYAIANSTCAILRP